MSPEYTVSLPKILNSFELTPATGSEYQGPPFDAYYDRYGLNATTAPYPW